MLKFVFLSEKFYEDHASCKEIEQKKSRPYIQVEVLLNGVLFGVPLRSNINHPHVLWTDKENRCGVDFSKAVVISCEEDIDRSKAPYIRPNEFKALKGKDHIICEKLKKYISDYKKAKERPDIERNQRIIAYSTLQYFEEYI